MNPTATSPESPTTGKPRLGDLEQTTASAAGSPAPNSLRVTKVLVPVDFSPPSRRAFGFALEIAKTFGAEISLVHVIEVLETPVHWKNAAIAADFEHNRKTLQRELESWAEGATVKCHAEARLGRVWREIVHAANEQEASLIVIATHGYTGLHHTLLGSVAEKVVRHATCPVLTLRVSEADLVPASGNQPPPSPSGG